MPSPSKTPKEIFLEAAEQADSSSRARYLSEACGENAELRRHVEALLRVHDEPDSLLDQERIPAPVSMDREIPSPTLDQSVARPGTQIGPYKLLQQIGEGGMGVVYMAEQKEPVERRVALKIIKQGMDTRQVIARFEAERQALSLMDHPNIAKVLDAGTTESGRPYFVMELVKGQPITQYCDEHHLTPRQRLELLLPVCQAIQHAHQKGIIHRDIKPTNILVTEYDEKPVPKVIDFGVAKATSQALTEKTMFTGFGQIVGTLEYMSPEQAKVNQLDIDTRSDIYSLGVLLYELLTGSTPFDKTRLRSAAFDEMLRIIREEEPEKPSTRLSSVGSAHDQSARGEAVGTAHPTLASIAAVRSTEPAKLRKLVRGELDWIAMKALEKDRSRRYETANGFAADIQRYLDDEPVLACPPSAVYRFRKLARRNKAALATASLIGLAVLASVVVLAVSNVRIRQETHEKEQALDQAKRQEDIAKKNAKRAADQTLIALANARDAKTQEQLARRRYYAAQMNLAMQAWRAGETPRVLELLEGQRPRPGEEDPRGFEWFYLWRLVNAGRGAPIAGHNNAATSVAFSPDGKTLASASWDKTVRLWDTSTGQELRVLRGHSRGVWEVAFSPDGQTVAGSGHETRSLILWNVETGQPLHTIDGSVAGLRFTPDGKSVVGGLIGGMAIDFKEWDVASGAERAKIANAGVVLGLIPASHTLVTMANQHGPSGEIRFWNLETGSRHRTIPTYFDSVALSPDGTRVATSSAHRGIEFWDTATGMQVARIPTPSALRSLAFSPDGKSLAGGSEGRTVTVWEVETGRQIGEDVHLDPVWGLAFSPDGKTLASSTLAGAIKLWDMTPTEEAATIPGIEAIPNQPGFSRCLRFTPDGKGLLVGHAKLTKLIDVAAGKEIAVLPASTVGAISADVNVLAGRAGADGYVLWDVRAGRKLAAIAFPQISDVPQTSVLSGDGSTLACYRAWRGENTVTLWDVATLQSKVLKIAPPESNRLSVTCAEFSPDGKLLAAGFQFQWVTVWDVATGMVKLQFSQKPSMMNVISVAFSPGGKTLAVGTDVGAVTLWDVATGNRLVAFRGHTSYVFGLAFSPDGRTLATAGADRTVRLWDVVTGQERSTLTGHTGPVTNVVFSPDGFTLATASGDGTVKLWQAATDGVALAPSRPLRTDSEPSPLNLPPAAMPSVQVLLDSARPFAESRDWKQAAAELDKGGESQRSDLFLCYSTALARLLAGDVDGYARLAAGMPVLESATGDRWSRLDVLRTCTVHPRGAVDPAPLVPLAQSAYDEEVNNWSAQNLGMAHYRAGDFDKALRRFEEALKLTDWFLFWPAYAMCHHQLGHADEARQWLDKSNEFFRHVTATSREPLKVTKEPFWQDWAYFEVMLQEANALIGKGK